MSEFYNGLAETEYGAILQDNVRFGRFKPGWMANEVWVDLLGPDVDNYKHMEWTAGITAWYTYEAEELGAPFNEEDKDLLMTTAWVHDFAEAIDGDIPDPDKDHSIQAKAKEYISFLTVARTVTDSAVELADKVYPALFGQHPLSRHFRAIEIIGYTETGKRAGKEAFNMRHLQDIWGYDKYKARLAHIALLHLHDEVVPSALNSLGEFKDLPVVAKYLGENNASS